MTLFAPAAMTRRKSALPQNYNPEKGLKTIAVSEAAEKHFARAKDATQLFDAIGSKLTEQAKYVVWRDGLGLHGGDRLTQDCSTAILPTADPGHVVIHRWRKRLCSDHQIDKDKLARAIDDAGTRATRICEQEKTGTVRGTEGTGEFELYTPAKYIEAARSALGEIDLDPASNKIAQETVKATRFFTSADDGLKQEWHGRVWLNPPYHRELLPAFVSKMVGEAGAGRVTAALMLTNNCTDTDWFLAAQSACQAICFTHGRVKFERPDGEIVAPTQGQAFFYFGDDIGAFTAAFAHIGFGVKVIW